MTAVDEAIAALATRQNGLVALSQLLASGIPRAAIGYRVRAGALKVVQVGVYQVGPVQDANSRERAALLACGAHAVLSHRTAAVPWKLLSPPKALLPVEVTSLGSRRRRRPGIIHHRTKAFEPGDVVELDRLPLTAPIRTIVDLASVLVPHELEQALARAEREGLLRRSDLEARVARLDRRRGAAVLRALLRDAVGPAFTRSVAEERLLALVRKSRIARPATNVRVADLEVDFFWPNERVVVEVDGFAYHGSNRSFERDRARDADLSAIGVQVVRVTWRQLMDESEAFPVRLAQTLAVRRGLGAT